MATKAQPQQARSPLARASVMTFVATANARRAREFYADVLGLKFVSEDRFALVFDLSGTMLRIQKIDKLTPAQFTVLGWQVSDIAIAAKQLAARGVKFERFQGMEQDTQGVWQSPAGARVAWFKDPDGNTLSLTEFPKEKRAQSR